MIRELIVVGAVLAAAPAQAALVTYTYHGNDILCHEDYPCHTDLGYEPGDWLDNFSGSFTIDQALYPGGHVAGSTLLMEISDRDWGYGWLRVSVERPFDLVYRSFVPLADGPSFLVSDTYIFNHLLYRDYWGYFTISFDRLGDVTSWASDCLCGSPDWDPFSSNDGDSFGGGGFAPPGSWTREGSAAAIPLPAGAWLLLGGMGTLFALRAKRGQRRLAA